MFKLNKFWSMIFLGYWINKFPMYLNEEDSEIHEFHVNCLRWHPYQIFARIFYLDFFLPIIWVKINSEKRLGKMDWEITIGDQAEHDNRHSG